MNMKPVFAAAMIAAAGIAASTPGLALASGHGFGRGIFHNPTALFGGGMPPVATFPNRIPAPLAAPPRAPVRDRNPARTARRAFVAIKLATALLAGTMPALAQQQLVPNLDRLRMQAPIGARQPRPSDLPPKVLEEEKHLPAGRNGADLDSGLNICRGC
jgi:hypothetical protein